MTTAWLPTLTAALAAVDEAHLVNEARAALGGDTRITVWRPAADGWDHAEGDPGEPPTTVPLEPGTVPYDDGHLVRASTDATAARLLYLRTTSVPADDAAVAAELLRVALERLTERKAAHDAAQRLADNERIGALGSYDWHVPTDTNHWSDELYRIYGEEPQSFNASYERFIEFIHPDDRDKVRDIHQRAFATGEPYEMEERIVLADGTERLLWSNGEVVMGPDGTPERFIGICRDVTAQRAAESAAAETAGLRQHAHDMELRRRAALELNDAVVQGLTAAVWATETGAEEVARDLLDETIASARQMMDDLLVDSDGSVPGPGELRRTAAPQAHIEATPAPPPSDVEEPTPGRRVVIADDAPDVRLLLGIHLKTLGFEVVGEAATGREAVDLVAEHDPDIVLLDLSMPEMDGLEAATEIRRTHPGVRIVVVSGYAASSMAEQAEAAGADAYLEKGADLRRRLAPLLEVAA